MPSECETPDLLGDLERYATDIACWRVEAIEKYMRRAPDSFPDYAQALVAIEQEKASLIQKLGGDDFALELLMNALMAYHGELVFAVYRRAVLDGGRVYHAFITGELPVKEDVQ